MSTSAIGTVLDAIRAGLAARPGLTDVNVFTGPISREEAGLECIAFGEARLNEEPHTMGGNKAETWDVDGETRVVESWQGDTEDTIEAARDRALELFAEVETYLNDTYVADLPNVKVTSGSLTQDITPDGRACSLLFTMTVRAVKNP